MTQIGKGLALLVALAWCCAAAQGQSVTGIVTDHKTKEPLPGATVVWLGTAHGTATDGDGRFELPRKGKGDTLLAVMMVGYRTDTVASRGGETLAVELKAREFTLDAVVVTGRQKGNYQKLTTIRQEEVITVEGLRGLACCNLGESFENSATVDVGYSDAVSGSRQIQLLGLTGVYSLMLLENTPFLRGLSAPFGLGYVPGQWMEGISVSKGVATVKNGYEAITGTINLEYEKPDKGDMLTLNLYENSDLKSELTAKANIQFNERLSTGLYLFGTYNGKRTDHLGHDGFMDYPLQNQYNIVNRWTYEKPGGLCSQTLVNYTHEDRLGGEMDFEKEMRGSTSLYGLGGTTDRIHFFTKNGCPINGTSSFGSQVTATYFRQEAFYGLSSYTGQETDLYANLLVNAEVSGGHIVDYGASVRYSDYSETLASTPYLGAATQMLGEGLGRVEVVPGVFGQFTFHVGTKFNLTGGLRYDYNSGYERHLLTPRVHFRWEMAQGLVLRGAGGKGYRSTNAVAENFGLLASSRELHLAGPLKMEDAWNGGLNLVKKISIWNEREMSVALDFYHTQFMNQVVIDLDRDANEAWIGNLDGKSYSRVAQADININVAEGLDIALAGKLSDVRCTYHGVLMAKPYTSKWKGLVVVTYHTRFDKWRFDLTTQFNGPQRLPLNSGSLQGEAPASLYMLGQVTRKFKHFEIYAGVENLTNHTQEFPVTGYDVPFSQAFDASIVYAPLMGRLWYGGLRFNIR